MKKIMIVHEKMVIGGVEMVLLNLLLGFDYKKYEVDLYLKQKGGELYSDIPKEVNVFILSERLNIFKNDEKYTIYEKILKKFIGIRKFYYDQFKEAYMKNRYDVSISFQGLNKLLDLFAGLAPANKKIIWCHGDFLALAQYKPWFKKTFNIDKYKYKYFDYLIAVSETSAKNFLKLYNKEYKVKYLWNKVNGDLILKESRKKPRIILDGNYNIIFIGRLVDDKAVSLLVEAHEKLINEKLKIKTYIVGNGPNYQNIKNMIDEKNLSNSLIMLGLIKNPFDILKQADLLVLPSRNEGYPTVLMEALVLGIPFVATNICGSSDIYKYVAPKKSSILVNSNSKSIAKGIKAAYEGKIKKGYFFDYKTYNKKIDQKILSIMEEKKDEKK